jgi:hypothetical protein
MRTRPTLRDPVCAWLGVDPGRSSGAIALILPDGRAETWKLADMTDKDIWETIHDQSGQYIRAVLENVHAMPKQGCVSSFKFGASFGEMKMALVAAGIPFELISPQKWQKLMGCLTKGDKNVSKSMAQRLWPNIKITHATADSLLMAETGRRFL